MRLPHIPKEHRKTLLIGVAAVVASLLLIQFWPGSRDFTNPPVVSEPEWDSEYTRHLAWRACFDCHSYETEWPWYTQIVPIANLVQRDVKRGREVYNFSAWEQTCCTQEQIDEMAKLVNKRQMPLPYFIVIHPETQLSDVERGQLVNGLIVTMQNNLEDAP